MTKSSVLASNGELNELNNNNLVIHIKYNREMKKKILNKR